MLESSATMPRIGECAYCWNETELTTEHATARWVPGKIPDSESIAPVRGRHMFAGELTIDDVCGRCNNGRLGQLDQYAESWWDRNVHEHVTELDADEVKLGKWLAKGAFNMQRIEKRERQDAARPPIPDDAIRWIIGEGRLHDSLGIVVAGLPGGHYSAANAGHDSAPMQVMPLRWTHLRGLVFMIVWQAKNWDVPVAGMVRMICDSMPGVALDLLGGGNGPRTLPIIAKPDFVEKGLYDNHALRIAMTEHWRKERDRTS